MRKISKESTSPKKDPGSHFTYLTDDFLKRDRSRTPVITPVFEEKVTIQYHDPNFNPDIIDGLSAMGYRGLVIAGTGLGHVNKPRYPAIKRAIQKGMTSRPRDHPARQHAARDGVHEAVMGARADRRPGEGPHIGYLILQDGLPEVESFVKQHWK